MPGLSRDCGSGASRSAGRPQPFPVHSFASTHLQQEGLETPREKNEILPTNSLQTCVWEMRVLQDYGEEEVPTGKKETALEFQ